MDATSGSFGGISQLPLVQLLGKPEVIDVGMVNINVYELIGVRKWLFINRCMKNFKAKKE